LLGVGFGAGAVDDVDFLDFMWCFLDAFGVVDAAAPDDEDELDVDGAVVGFGAGAEVCAATAIGRPNARARLTSFFMTVFSCFAMPLAS
jgi:hypothetical protein